MAHKKQKEHKLINLSKNVKICKSAISQARGLMFSTNKGQAILFIFKKEKIVPLHMMFVFFPIDVLFLNQNKEIVEMKKNFKPFHLYHPKNKAKYIIELPQGTIKANALEKGDTVNFK